MLVARQQILQLIEQDRLPHALLLVDQDLSTSLELAETLSQWLLCLQPVNTLQACHHCQACQWFKAKTHPDFRRLELEEKSQVIKVDGIRHLLSGAHQQSACSSYQVILIHQACCLNTQASNALLKFLEEPREHTHIILTATHETRLLPTILSRCQIFHCDSNGGKKTNDKELYDELAADLQSILLGQGNPLSIAERWNTLDVSQVLYSLLALVSDVVRFKLAAKRAFSAQSIVESIAAVFSLKKLYQLIDDVIQIRRDLSHTGVNTEIALDVILLNFNSREE